MNSLDELKKHWEQNVEPVLGLLDEAAQAAESTGESIPIQPDLLLWLVDGLRKNFVAYVAAVEVVEAIEDIAIRQKVASAIERGMGSSVCPN